MSNKIKLLWKAPNLAVAQRGPRYLEFVNREGKTEFFAPQMDENGNITYTVDEEYGRRLLAGQADRFFLLSPAELILKRRRKDQMGSEYVKVKALTALSSLDKPAEEPTDPPPAQLAGTEPSPDAQSAPIALEAAAASAEAKGKSGNRPKPTA